MSSENGTGERMGKRFYTLIDSLIFFKRLRKIIAAVSHIFANLSVSFSFFAKLQNLVLPEHAASLKHSSGKSFLNFL
jgi:hypothetical protein